MARIVHASDLHIDSLVGLPPGRTGWLDPRRVVRAAVVNLVDLVLRESADLLIISGDVFDRTADSTDAGRFFATEMDRLVGAGVPVLAAAGNHDAACPRAMGYPSQVRWFGAARPATHVFEDLGVAVHGQGLADPAQPSDLVDGYPAALPGLVNIGVLHTSLDGHTSRTVCAPTSLDRLRDQGYDYWALGHVHRRRVVATHPWVVYPGILQGRGPDESGSTGATVITLVGGDVAAVEHRDLSVLRWPARRVLAPQPG